ncbi:fungal hydrophobin-domain-containing protein [Collybia nuda]|uniref:Hydrophobin n=1 Tax=Collybia nuda TaxID=64659 RepID=A0A9P6CE09_9AGAR|nr:fungal hydrophobin-domain-containing protein [Collybia nuda]
MKFTSASALAVLALPLLTAATVLPRTTTPTTPASQCNVSNLKCCNSTQESDALLPPVTTLLGLLGINLSDLTALVGVTCGGLNILSLGVSDCTAQPVCCSNNNFSGIVALGCTLINLSL